MKKILDFCYETVIIALLMTIGEGIILMTLIYYKFGLVFNICHIGILFIGSLIVKLFIDLAVIIKKEIINIFKPHIDPTILDNDNI